MFLTRRNMDLEGIWTLYAVFQGCHGKMVERAAPGGEDNVIDHFSRKAWLNYLQRYNHAFQGRTIGRILQYQFPTEIEREPWRAWIVSRGPLAAVCLWIAWPSYADSYCLFVKREIILIGTDTWRR